ncbi:TenA family transcriptional regulator [Nesterenkonia sp. AN1]|uniref:Thiaminase /4-amino-5-aminomethyl-2-methylpyrimidine deaminase n=1 Tax=Nesterenkonia aurantiaca TaxID=1436010 RepID=A0A4R7G2A1_9MICC|nr:MULTISPECIES: TenA family protein [Nesterenkonia]EXF26101.1 TenA family transcriptional regulator [Nesterenkonia sp. AN1]TDS85443.1 thiaminase /4-amino-5-aminomethyl-2-methylpyrimidine deaminase [Nesterenkonia aurantiaca]
MSARRFTEEAWASTEEIRARIETLPFLEQLEAGSLPREIFDNYMGQDALYLTEYARALAACATQSTDPEHIMFWSRAAAGAIEEERALHSTHVVDFSAVDPSPTTVAYTSYELALISAGSLPVLAASVLPCFWIYDDVGTRLKARVESLEEHPYADWISAYGDPEFHELTETAKRVVDELAATASEQTRAAMHAAYRRASQYEWMFWDSAYRQERWPVG